MSAAKVQVPAPVAYVVLQRGELAGVRYVGGCALGFGFARCLTAIVVHPRGCGRGWTHLERFLMN